MERFKIGPLWVQFPFVPYVPQEVFMKKMIESMDNAQNALLESPTGTGKTLCLVCAALAWLDYKNKADEMPQLSDDDDDDDDAPATRKPRKPEDNGGLEKTLEPNESMSSNDSDRKPKYKIYFCTRTHSQLIQAVNEFKNTSYGHVRSATLGSRKHLCLNPVAIKAGSNLDDKCASLRKKRETPCSAPLDIEDLPRKCTSCLDDHRCQYYSNFEEMVSNGDDRYFTQAQAMDQRKLIEKCREHKVCPFYMSRHLQKRADMIFLPYSYIFNPHILKGLQLNVKDSIIIIDEGHNLEKVCEENASFDMYISNITNCKHEVIKALEQFHDENFPPDVSVPDMQELERVLEKLEKEVFERIKPGLRIPHYDGAYCMSVFEAAGLTKANYERLQYKLKQISTFLGGKELKTDGIRKITNVVNTLFTLDGEGEENQSILKESFVLFKEVISPEDLRKNQDLEPKISFWCFNAGIIMKSLMAKGVRSFIVTSGTLAPLRPLRESLSIPFPVDLLNEHVVDSSQVLSLCITEAPTCKGDKKALLDASFKKREANGNQLYDALGNVVREVLKCTPKGVLIFFPSSAVKNACTARWSEIFNGRNNISLFHELDQLKPIFEEPKEASELNDLQLKYSSKIENSSGACLIGVTSGKVSEGIDFKDDLGRAVIMVGLPYPPAFDPWVRYKRNHLLRTKGSAVEAAWYLSQAIRPVNQALGRIIRHQKDYGCVLLPDDRYTAPRVREALPRWLESNMRIISFAQLGISLRRFFSTIHFKIREVEQRTLVEQAASRRRHQEELDRESLPSSTYFTLRSRRDAERQRQERLHAEMQILLRAMREESMALEGLQKQVSEKAFALQVKKKREEEAASKTKEENNPDCDPEKKDCDDFKQEDLKVKKENDSACELQVKKSEVAEIKEESESGCESDGKSDCDETMSESA